MATAHTAWEGLPLRRRKPGDLPVKYHRTHLRVKGSVGTGTYRDLSVCLYLPVLATGFFIAHQQLVWSAFPAPSRYIPGRDAVKKGVETAIVSARS